MPFSCQNARMLVLVVAIRPPLDFQQLLCPPVLCVNMDNCGAWEKFTSMLDLAGAIYKSDRHVVIE